ncbi:unnamed protein product [Effrenium voratum]|nr:unnamed protein product [Effrenium voratum]
MGRGQRQTLNYARLQLADSDVPALGLKQAATHYGEVDVSQNRLSAKGIEEVVNYCIRCSDLRVLKAYKNEIGDAGARHIARLIRRCRYIEEVHLSHNQLTEEGVRVIIEAACSRPQQASPLWLRLERNWVAEPASLLQELVDHSSVCGRTDERRCTNRHCAWKRQVHVPFLHMQREVVKEENRQSKIVQTLFREYEKTCAEPGLKEEVESKKASTRTGDWQAETEPARDPKTQAKDRLKKESQKAQLLTDTRKEAKESEKKAKANADLQPAKAVWEVRLRTADVRPEAAQEAAQDGLSGPDEAQSLGSAPSLELEFLLAHSWRLKTMLNAKQQMTGSEDVAWLEACVRQLHAIMEDLEPERQWKTEPFGSMKTGFCLRGCDLDIAVLSGVPETAINDKDILAKLSSILAQKPEFKVKQVVPWARVPILKLEYRGRDVDISVNNFKAVANSKLLAAYARLDPLIPEFGTAVKLWAKASQLCGASEGNLSSYAFILMAVYFLQVASGDELPCLQDELPSGWDGDDQALDTLAREQCKNWRSSSSLWMYLAGFFAFYSNARGPLALEGYEPFRWGEEVVSVRLGRRSRRLTVESEEFQELGRRQKGFLHIEDPVELSRNLRDALWPGHEELLRHQLQQTHGIFVLQAKSMLPGAPMEV